MVELEAGLRGMLICDGIHCRGHPATAICRKLRSSDQKYDRPCCGSRCF
jgi:hypothetical protein